MYEKQYKPESRIINGMCKTTFRSISHFVEYVNGTMPSEHYRMREHVSQETNSRNEWFGTNSYEEAQELLNNGYREGTEKLQQRLKAQTHDEDKAARKIISDVVGFQPIVPNYLIGLPNSMVNTKLATRKQKVITINKDISYHCGFTTEQIFEFSARTLRIIQSLEAQGHAVNLNIVFSVRLSGTQYAEMVKVRIKNANERLNLQKLSFPLVHPSMLRRMCFKYIEVSDTTESFDDGYGTPTDERIIRQWVNEDKEIYLSRTVSESDMKETVKLMAEER